MTLERSFAMCLVTVVLFGCGKSDDTQAEGTPGEGGLTAAQLAGTWNMRAVPFSGDSTPTMSVLKATPDMTGWTLTFPNRPGIATQVSFDADSVMTESGPYESVRKRGVQVTTTGVYRLRDSVIEGIATARYMTRGVDSVMNFRVTGTRAP
ncbi:MAG TPA: hypothetical protein VNO75_12910 [Gemmatimonadaceae bacterium]|nr:hypothetical protein [Gemmatimonadaceae bacterium]